MALDQWSRFLKDTRLDTGAHSKTVRFASGLTLSVQASRTHYCSPKEDDPKEGWTSFEVYTYSSITLHDQRMLGVSNPTKTELTEPIGWVSIFNLNVVAENNGGICGCVEDSDEDYA
jgi:hypothetical protein